MSVVAPILDEDWGITKKEGTFINKRNKRMNVDFLGYWSLNDDPAKVKWNIVKSGWSLRISLAIYLTFAFYQTNLSLWLPVLR